MQQTTNIWCADKQCWTWDYPVCSSRPQNQPNNTSAKFEKKNIMFSSVVKLTRNAHAVGAPGPFRMVPGPLV